MGSRSRAVARSAGVLLLLGATAGFSYLKGTREKMMRQNAVAHEDQFVFATTPAQISQLVMQRQLVPLPGSADYTTKGVSFPDARPEVLTFVEHLAQKYRPSCGGQPMVITSLVRPLSLQPRNASPLSVHPAGMAVDLHVPNDPACRVWLVKRLLTLASYNVLDVTEEMHPHHLHVAVFPHAYLAWLARQPKTAVPPSSRGSPPGRLAGRGAQGPPVSFLGMGDARTVVFVSGLGLLVVLAGLPLRRRARVRTRRGRFGPGTRADR